MIPGYGAPFTDGAAPGRRPFEIAEFSNVDAAEDPSAFVSFLDEMRGMGSILRGKRTFPSILGLGPGRRVLDVGCGTGDDVIDYAAYVGSNGSAVGVDLSSAMVDEARARARRRRAAAEFVEADAQSLPFPDACFDACVSDRMLQHVHDPARAVAEMARVLVPGGRIVVADIDHELAALDIDDVEVSRAVRRTEIAAIRNPRIGRTLNRHLVRSGFLDVAVKGRVHIWQGGPEYDYEGVRRRILELADNGELTRAQADLYVSSIHSRLAEGTYFFAGVMFYASGRKAMA